MRVRAENSMGIEERKQREKNERRRQILAAAMEIYDKEGYHGITMEKIAEAAELSRATLYLYFNTRDEILTHAILSFLDYFGQLLHELNSRADDHKGNFLDALWDVFMEFYQQDPVAFGASLYFHQGEIIRSLAPELRNMLAERGSMNYRYLCEIVQKGIDMGYLVPQDPRTLAEVIWSSFLGIVHLEHSKKAMGRKSHLEQSCSLALEALKKGLTIGEA